MKPVLANVAGGDMTKAHFAQLDGLRGVAILAVMIYHFCLPHRSFHSSDPGLALQLGQGGWMGVDLFFVLSGFLITGILTETRSRRHYFRNFLGRRFLRIWPLYYLSLVMLLVVMPLLLPDVPKEVQGMQAKQAWFWLYGANWLFAMEGGFSHTSGGYFWSLAVEEQFYVVWPLVVFLVSELALLRISIALLVLSLVSRIVLIHMGVGTGALYTMTFAHLDGLAVGSCLAVCWRSPGRWAYLARLAPAVAAASAAGLLVVRLIDGNLFFWSTQMATYGYTLIALLGGAVLVQVLCKSRSSRVTRWLTSDFMKQCGKYSYALYIVHVPVAGVMFPLTFHLLGPAQSTLGYGAIFAAFCAAAFAASWGLSAASWHLFEKHILALKRYLSYDEADAGQASSAVPSSSARRLPG